MDAKELGINLKKLWDEIEEAHDATFIRALMAIPGARVLAYGGIVYDSMLGKKWKDLDLRVLLNRPWKEMWKTVEKVVKKHTVIKQTVPFEGPGGFIVWRVTVSGKKKQIIDIAAARTMRQASSDLRFTAIFIDLKTGEVVEQRPGCLSDFKRGVIKTLNNPHRQFKRSPHEMLRVIKAACKSDFKIDPEVSAAMKHNAKLLPRAFEYAVKHIKKNGKDSWAEYLLGNIFKGLSHNARLYFALMDRYGFLKEFILYLRKRYGNSKTDALPKTFTNLFKSQPKTFEEAISLFLSFLAKEVGVNPKVTFFKFKRAFGLHVSHSTGEFPINPKEIIYR